MRWPRQNLQGNVSMFGASALALSAWSLMPEIGTPSTTDLIIPAGLGVGSAIGAGYAAIAYVQDFATRKRWQEAHTPSQEKDDRLLSEAERKETGMRDPKGRLIGTTRDGKPIFLPHRTKIAFQYILGGQGTGKTTTAVIASSIMTPLLSGKSVFLNDVKKEILPQVIEALKGLGIEVLCVNIGGGAQDTCPGSQVPPFELATDAYYSDDPEFHQLTNTFIRGYAAIAVEIRPDEKTPFFGENGQKAFHAFFVYLLIYEPDNIAPTRIWEIASDLELAVRCLERLKAYAAKSSDTVIEDGQRSASTLLDMHKGTPKYLPQFLNKIVIGLSCYDATGPLAHFGRHAAGRVSDMRMRQMVFASMIPLANLNDMKAHISFLAFNFFGSAKAFPHGRAIHGIFEEFQALNLPGYAHEMLSMRGLKVSSENYIQSPSALEESIGPHQARVIFEQSDLIQALSLSSDEEAKRFSAMIGKRTVRRRSATIRSTNTDDVGFGLQDHEESIFTPQELIALPIDEQIIKIRGMRPDHLRKIPYWDVDGLKSLVGDNPLEGSPPETKPKLGLRITKESIEVLWWRKPKGFRKARNSGPKRERLLRFSSFLWLYAWVAIIVAGGFQFTKPAPHVYVERTAAGCKYLSVHGQWVIRPAGGCTPIWIDQDRSQ